MKVSTYSDREPVEELEGVFRRDVLTADDGVPLVSMHVFEIAPKVSTPSHYHPWEHEVFVVSGTGLVVGEQGSIAIGPGNIVFIPPNEPHCFVNTGVSTIQFVCVEPLKKK